MIAHDLERLQRITADLPQGTRLRLTLSGHARSDDFQAYGRQLTAASTAIDLLTDVTADPEPPWLETTNGIRFHALPEGDKLDRLVDALRPPGGRDARPLPDHQTLLEAMTLPATVRLFIAPGCPFCPQAMLQWIALARSGNQLRLHIIDGALFPEVAQDAICDRLLHNAHRINLKGHTIRNTDTPPKPSAKSKS